MSFAGDGREFMAIMHGADPATAAGGGGTGGAGKGAKGKIASATISASFDVILLDRHMPNLEGPDAVRYYCLCCCCCCCCWCSERRRL